MQDVMELQIVFQTNQMNNNATAPIMLHGQKKHMCKTVMSKNRMLCGPLYFMSFTAECIMFGSKQVSVPHITSYKTVNCNISDDKLLQNDLVVDCDQSGEAHLMDLAQGHPTVCHNPMELPCLDGHSKCFNLSHICVFELNKYSHLYPCRNGGHLENCQQFECNRKFKCPDCYCISWSFVCDSKWDCPSGEDESIHFVCKAKMKSCMSMLKCFEKQVCVPLSSICDASYNCPYHNDEQFCEVKDVPCPANCSCLALALHCKEHHAVQHIYPFLSIFVNNSPFVKTVISKFSCVLFLTMENSSISELDNIIFPETILYLSLRQNMIKTIPIQSFRLSSKLHTLLLEFNSLESVNETSFSKLTQLVFLNLSNNPFTMSPAFSFSNQTKMISLRGILFLKISQPQK